MNVKAVITLPPKREQRFGFPLAMRLLNRTIVSTRGGFTLIEMLIAMTVTLLLMAALGSGFAMIGETIRDSRVQVELSGELRDITNRLQDELRQATVPMRPASGVKEPPGYFMFYEGPLTDATSSIFRAVADPENPVPDSRYGDFDDYLAFTAVASGDNWFTGKVPRFILDQKTAELSGATYDPTNFPGNPWDAVVIRSKYAEIVYFAGPEYVTASLPQNPTYIDVDGNTNLGSGDAIENGFPDSLRLHRRVLLVRPDLNLSGGFITPRELGGINYMLADQWPIATEATITEAANPADAWLYGMAGVHQQCDLSLRRVLDASGRPTQNVAANSLEDLSKPHNRFGHVRVPGAILGLGTDPQYSSMPLLALSSMATVFNSQTTQGNLVGPDHGAMIAANAGSGAAVITPRLMSGCLRPEFVLGADGNHPSNLNHPWGPLRIGEDVVATNVLAFDIKIFDRLAPVITTSQGQVVAPHSSAFREALREQLSGSAAEVQRGAFVDLMYPVLAGGSLRGWQTRPFDRLTPTNQYDATFGANAAARDLLVTEFSGLAGIGGNAFNTYTLPFYRSGKILIGPSDRIQLFQPTFDTFTYHYERDGFRQVDPTAQNRGTRWRLDSAPTLFDTAADGINHGGGGGSFAAGNFFDRETSPPFLAAPRALEVTIRIENPANRQLRQATVVHQGHRD